MQPSTLSHLPYLTLPISPKYTQALIIMAEQRRDWTAFGKKVGQKCAPVAGGFVGIWAVLSHIGINFGPDLFPDFSSPAENRETPVPESNAPEAPVKCQLIIGDVQDSTITIDESFKCETTAVEPKETVLVLPATLLLERQQGETGWTANVIQEWLRGERENLPSPGLSVNLKLDLPRQTSDMSNNLVPLIPRPPAEFNFLPENIPRLSGEGISPETPDCFNADILDSGSDWCSPESRNF
ncbi:MAG: hypothetical protein AAF921_00145 [Cyanobacteria bacterium P01_D01_bin.44]